MQKHRKNSIVSIPNFDHRRAAWRQCRNNTSMVQFNHTIVYATDQDHSASFWALILGLRRPLASGPFTAVSVANGVTFDFFENGIAHPQHYAFLVADDEFDAILSRVRAREITIWADPLHHLVGEINRDDGGRGFYFQDPAGHNLEVSTS